MSATTVWLMTRLHREAIRALRLALVAAAGLALTSPLAAQNAASPEHNTTGFYAGGEVGALYYINACEASALSCARSTWAAAAFGGYQVNTHLAFELGYRKLGEARAVYPRLTGTLEVSGDAQGGELAVLASIPLNRLWQAYVRGGAFYWDAETRSSEFRSTESGWSATLGAGFTWQFRPAWQARVQYLYLGHVGGERTGASNSATLSLGLSYLFGASPPP